MKAAQSPGKVYLVGAWPGASDLITVRGQRLLEQVQVVLHDALVDPQILAWCKQATLFAVGKRCGNHSCAQTFINKRLVDAAMRHKVVVRLIGGDPMMFGRADEEIRALQAAGIDYVVVPGVTAALAASASLGHSLTLRGVARSVAFCTLAKADEAQLAQMPQADTLAIYMGRRQTADIAQSLLAQGRPADWPVCVVDSVSTAQGAASHWLSTDAPAFLLLGAVFGNREQHASVLADGRLRA